MATTLADRRSSASRDGVRSGVRLAPWSVLIPLLMTVALFGGGGTPAVGAEALVEVAAIGAALIAWPPSACWRGQGGWLAVAALALLAAVPLIQLAPLPAALWRGLPGRAPLALVHDALGDGRTQWPLSIAPERTLASALSLIPPIVALVFSLALPRGRRAALMTALVLIGVASALMQAVEQATGAMLPWFVIGAPGFPGGLFANHNSQADLLVIAMAAALWRLRHAVPSLAPRGALGAAIATMLAALLVGGSRAGIALALLLVPLALLLWRGAARRWPTRWLWPVMIVALVLVPIGLNDGMIARSLGRFAGAGDERLVVIWPDALFTLRRFWPAGAGVGTFVPAFAMNESLELVTPAITNRAHCDYLEWAIETGLPGVLLLIALLILLAWRVVRAVREAADPAARDLALTAAFAFAVIALHSLVDYPLRAITIAVVAAVLLGQLLRAGQEPA